MVSDSSPQNSLDNPDSIHLSIEKKSGAKRAVNVRMQLDHPIEKVWQLITNYEQLADLIPNLAHSHQLSQSEASKHLEMIGTCRIFNLEFSLRLVLEVVEFPPYQIQTQLIEGDLRSYLGQWQLQEVNDCATLLTYSAEIVPKAGIPIDLLEYQARRLLPANFLAIRQYLDQIN